MAHLKAAQFAYDNMYDLPDYPPDVKFSPGVNQDAEITLTWNDDAESSVNPDFGDADVVGYRVFRSAYQEFGPWEDVGTVTAGTSGSTWDYSGGQYVWRDNTAVAGFPILLQCAGFCQIAQFMEQWHVEHGRFARRSAGSFTGWDSKVDILPPSSA